MDAYQKIKIESEKYWQTKLLTPNIYGHQIQQDSKWNKGLSESEIESFEKELGIVFNSHIKSFYMTMNGLNKKGVNIFGGEVAESDYKYFPVYFEYPKDIEIIKDKIRILEEDNKLSYDDLTDSQKLLPISANKYMLNNDAGVILSMHHNDNIIFTDSLIDYLNADLSGRPFPPATVSSDDDMKLWL